MTPQSFRLLVGAVAIGVATTLFGLAVAMFSESESLDRVGALLLAAGSATQPGLHNFIAIGFALIVNVAANAVFAFALLELLRRLLRLFGRKG